MRVVDKNAPSDVDKFWHTLGEMRVMSAIIGQSDEVIIEEKKDVVESLQAADAAEAGRAAFLRGVDRKLDELIAADAWALKNKPGHKSWIKSLLTVYVNSIPAQKV